MKLPRLKIGRVIVGNLVGLSGYAAVVAGVAGLSGRYWAAIAFGLPILVVYVYLSIVETLN